MSILLSCQDLSKSYGPHPLFAGVSLGISSGERLGFIGPNGAGKTTLMKILAGVQTPDSGETLLDGKPVAINSVRDATELGIALIHQELNLSGNLDVGANVYLGREPRVGGRMGIINRKRIDEGTRAVLRRVGLDVSPRTIVATLPIGQQQMIEIAKALSINARILIMDEPSAALGPQESAEVAALIGRLQSEGMGIFLVSHDLHDVFDLADRVAVLKGGRLVAEANTADVTRDQVLEWIIAGNRTI